MWYLPFTIRNLKPTAIRNSGSVPVEIEGCDNTWFKQYVIIEVLNSEKTPPINIHRLMQAVYREKCVDESTIRFRVGQFKQDITCTVTALARTGHTQITHLFSFHCWWCHCQRILLLWHVRVLFNFYVGRCHTRPDIRITYSFQHICAVL